MIRTLLDVTPDTVRLAERFGAKRDKLTLEWYVEGEDVPDELLNLVRKPMRTRAPFTRSAGARRGRARWRRLRTWAAIRR